MAATETGADAARELDELYREHSAEVYRYAYAVLGDSADAEDITQTTFVNALRALERGEHPRKPTNWLITIAHNLMRQRFRQQATRPREVELDRDLPATEAGDEGPAIEDLVRALQRIPPPQREALVLREMEGRSYKEISDILGVSQAALEARIFRARRSLAEELENLDTCDRAELALSRRADGRLSRKDRKRLVAHLESCPSCARVVVLGMRRRRAFKVLALVPLPLSLTLFKGAPSASAAATGAAATGAAGTAAAVGASGVTTKLAIALAAVAVTGGAGYEGVKAVRDPATPTPTPAAKTVPAAVVPAAIVPLSRPPASLPTHPSLVKPKAKPKVKAKARLKAAGAKPTRPKASLRGRSAAAPGHVKALPKAKKARVPVTGPARGRGPTARGSVRSGRDPKPVAGTRKAGKNRQARPSVGRPRH
ncbi:MAG TPA: sigma-70 family RNA polymerase sigma factor [Gaiellaceae bacterium]|nr:sigma-70 family RNA polymerase sigma factor [Gaiellaceae bacterium]